MNGARGIAELFSSCEQVGRLLIMSGSHARGRTLHVYVLPEGFAQPQGVFPGSNAVEVYGITGGQPGWTETYGWLMDGPWRTDFEQLVAERRDAAAKRRNAEAAAKADAAIAERERVKALLATHPNAQRH